LEISTDGGLSWTQYGCAPGDWQNIEHTFTASGPTDFIVWADAHECIDVDNIILEICKEGADMTTTYQLAGETTNDCPAGHESVLSEAECIAAAPSMCANGHGMSGAWNHDPVGCFVHPAASYSSCTVYFNTLSSSSPTASKRWKICKSGQVPQITYEERIVEVPPGSVEVPPSEEIIKQVWTPPTPAPALTDFGWSPSAPLGACQGDCDFDSDCANGLTCFERSAYEVVPGCSGGGKFNMDYCSYGCSKDPIWCTHSGSVYQNIDCDGDGVLDHYCVDASGDTGVIGSASSCADTWPSGTCTATTVPKEVEHVERIVEVPQVIPQSQTIEVTIPTWGR
jgi:hypothetical protein